MATFSKKRKVRRRLHVRDFSRASYRDAKRYFYRFSTRILKNHNHPANPYFRSLVSAITRIGREYA